MRSIGLDVHRDDGKVSRHPRVPARRAALVAFASSLRPTDQVGLEATGNALAIARIIEPHVARVVVANAAVTKTIGAARAKTDQLDARTLAQLLGTSFFPEVWLADGVELPSDERETVSSCLRQLRFLGEERSRLDQVIARAALVDHSIELLLTVPGVNLTTASAVTAAVGDISRFENPSQLVSDLGLDPKVHQSEIAPARHGSISKQPSAGARWALVEFAWVVARNPGPLRAFAAATVATLTPRRAWIRCSWSSSGTCSQRTRSTASADPRSPQRSGDGWNSRPEHPRLAASAAAAGFTPRLTSASASSRSPSMPNGPIASSSPNREPSLEPLDLHP